MFRSSANIIFTLIIIVGLSTAICAQQGTSPVGVNFILVNFDTPPTTLSVEQAPLKYNKDFALSIQVDDSDETIYTEGFQLFEGNDSYPGLNFSDGTGINHSFKMSSSTFIFSGTGVDLHNGYPNIITWTQLDTLYQNGWGILNHGVDTDASSDPLFIDYSIERNKSYIRRKLFNSTDGGVMVHAFVNPNGNENWTNPAFDKGYISAFRQSGDFPQGDNGGDVNASYVDWTQPVKFKRTNADNTDIITYVNNLANSSVGGANYWGMIFTHSLNGDYSSFTSDFTSIASVYGAEGLDNILMTTDEEIQDYLIVRDLTDISYALNGKLLLITFSGEVPNDLLFYSSSIVINSDAVINSITVDGADNYTETITNGTDALINVNWDGYVVIPPEVLGDSMVTIASASQTQYDCWVAMDYVITMTNGSHKDSLREVLCNIPNVVYDDGFCNCLIDLQPNDTTINQDSSILLTGPAGDYDYLWEDEIDSIGNTQVISVTPPDTTTYYLTATNPYGCPSIDSIIVNVRTLNIDIGDDLNVCLGSSVTVQGPSDMVQYSWYLNNVFAGSSQSIIVEPTEDLICKLVVIDQYGQTAQDSITITVLQLPDVYIQPTDSTIVLGNSIKLNGPIGNYSHQWYEEGVLISTSQNVTLLPGDTTQYNLVITDASGCSNEDSTMVNVHWYNLNLEPDTGYICRGDSLLLEGPPDMSYYSWSDGITVLGNSQNIYVKPNVTQQYFLTVTDTLGASDTDNIFVYVRTLPTVSIQSNDTLIKIGECDSIFGPNNFISYDWYEDGTILYGTTQNIEVCPTDTTQYLLIATDQHGCKGMDSITVSIDFLILDLGPDTTICEDKCVYIEGLPNMVSYDWSEDGVFYSSNQSIEPCPLDTTEYSLIVMDVHGNSASDTIQINVLPKSIINLGPPDSTIIKGDTITLYGAQGNNSWEWYRGNNFYSYNQNIIDWPADTIQYKHIATNYYSCVAMDSIMINVHSLSISLIQDTVYICNGDSVLLEGPANMALYNWYDGVSSVGNTQDIYVDPITTTQYTLSVTDTIGASAMDSLVVVVRSLPIVTIQQNDTTINIGACDSIFGPSGFDTYEWHENGISTYSTQDIEVCPVDTSQYILYATNQYGCTGSDTIVINVSLLTIDLGPDTTICEDNCVFLEGPPNMATYVWYEDGVIYSSNQSIDPCPIITTQYSLLVIDQYNVSARDTIQINVLPKPTINLGPSDTTIILGESIGLFGAPDAIMWEWYKGINLYSNNQDIVDTPTDTIQYKEISINNYGCQAEDSIMVNVHSFTFDLGPNHTIFIGNCDSIIGPPSMANYEWWVGDSLLLDNTQIIYPCPTETSIYKLIVTDTIGATAMDSLTIFTIDQEGSSPVGVDWIMVNFDTAPTTLTVEQAPLKYNKDFALSIQVDDSDETIYTEGFQLFESNGSYPGLNFSDGTGVNHSFKMSSSTLIFSGTGVDLHNGTSGIITWTQLDALFQNGWGILNHGVDTDASSDPLFIDYSIERNKSYIRRKLFSSTDGGVMVHAFVNPNGNDDWTIPAFDKGYISAFRQSGDFPQGNDGGDVNASYVDWTQPVKFKRISADNTNIINYVNQLASSSVGGANYWGMIFTHSLNDDYANFSSDFISIANTYGADGLDNILVATDEEIQDYLIVRDLTDISYVLNDKLLVITFNGNVPDDLLFYSSTILVNSDAAINKITVSGTDDYTEAITNNTDALINVNWDGYVVIPPEVLGDSMVTIASTSQTQYDCWVAMDYVITMTNGTHKDSLRQVLCSIPNVVYDDGFCNCLISLHPNDTTINIDSTIVLSGPAGDYDYLWEDETDSIGNTQIISVTPPDTTTYYLTATNSYGCPSIDSITVNIRTLNINIGDDLDVCLGDSVTIQGPVDMVQYQWFLNNYFAGSSQSIIVEPTESVVCKLIVIDQYGQTAQDSITITVLQLPDVFIQPTDSTILLGNSINLSGPIGNFSYQWFEDGNEIGSSQNVTLLPGDTTQYNLVITDLHGCSNEDSTMVNVHWYNLNLEPDTGYMCIGDSLLLEGPPDMSFYTWSDGITVLGNSQSIYVKPNITKQYFLSVTDTLGASDSDNIFVVVRSLPTVSIQSNDTLIKLGECDSIFGPDNFSFYDWYKDDSIHYASTQNIEVCPSDTTQYILIATDENGCKGIDSITVSIDFLTVDLGPDTTICEDICVYLEGLPNMVSYEWYADDIFISSNPSIDACPTISKNYSLTVVDQYTNSASDTIRINVLPKPIIYLGPPDTTILVGDTIELNGALGNNSWEWYKGNNFISYNQNIPVSPLDTVQYKHIATNGNGCMAKDSIMINVHSLTFSLVQDTVYICDGDSVQLLGPPSMTLYSWYDEFSVVGDIQNIYVNPNITTQYNLSVTDSLGASAMDSLIVVVRSIPIVAIPQNDTTISLGACDSIFGPSGFDIYDWHENGISTYSTQDIEVCPVDTSQYLLYATNQYGCMGSDSINVNIDFLIIDLGPDTTICVDNCVYLEGPPNMATYVWYEDGIAISSNQSIEPCPIDTTQYSLLVIDFYGNSDRDTIQINVLPKPYVNLGSPDTTIILGESIELFGAQDAIIWEWYKGTNFFWSGPSMIDSPTDTVQYKEIATNIYGCQAEDSIMVNVHSFTFDLGPNDTICSGDCDSIIGPPFMANYEWWVGDSLLSDTTQAIYQCPIDNSIYKLIVTDTIGASAMDSLTIFTLPLPVVDLQPQGDTINANDCIDLYTIDSISYSYLWYTTDTIFPYTTYLINTCPTDDSTKYYVLVTDPLGCSSLDSTMVYVNQLSFDLGPNDTICQNICIDIVGPDDMDVYEWTEEGAVIGTEQILTACPTNDLTQYKLWVENGVGATAEDSISIILKPAPIVTFLADTINTCYNDDALIIANAVDAVLYTWSYLGNTIESDSNSILLQNVVVPDSVIVMVTSENGCTDTAYVYLEVFEYPEIITTPDTSTCLGDSVELIMQGGSVFLWIVNEDTISHSDTIKVSPEVTTDFIAQTAHSDSLCYSVDTVTVVVNENTNTKIISDTNIYCTYDSVNLIGEGANEYLWSPGGDTTDYYSFMILDTTTIYLTGTNSNGCHSTDSITVYNKSAPIVSFTGLFPNFCENDEPVDLVGTPAGGTFSGSGINEFMFYPAIAGPGVHSIVYSLENDENCTGTDTVVTTVYSSGGVIDLGEDFALQLNESKILNAGTGFDSYFWTTGETTQSITVIGSAKPPGIYEYAVMGVINGCSTRGSVVITFENPDGYFSESIQNLQIYPNPNLGSFSIRFSSVEKNISINIYNLQGNIFYKKENISCNDDCNIDVDLIGVPSGFYFLKIATPKGVTTAKIILK